MSILTETRTPASRAAEKPKVSTAPTPRRSDQELQLARRIDWRFLLPEPSLRRVAYFGPETGTLPAALKHFSESFTFVSPTAENAPAQFDLAVLRLRAAEDLAKARALLATGGFLYWEMKPVKWTASLLHRTNGEIDSTPKRWRRVPDLFHDHVAALEGLEFQDIQMHWQRPNFEACLEIIPLNETALDYAFARPRGDLASLVKFAAGKVMMQTGMLTHLAPSFSLIARKE